MKVERVRESERQRAIEGYAGQERDMDVEGCSLVSVKLCDRSGDL